MKNNKMYITLSQGNKVSFKHNEWFLNFVINNLRGQNRNVFHCTAKQLEIFEKNTKDVHGARHNEKFWVSFDERYSVQICRNLVKIKDNFKEELEHLEKLINNLKEEIEENEEELKNGNLNAKKWILEDEKEIENLKKEIEKINLKLNN